MNKTSPVPSTAVVMNMFYTGLGIARALGERGIPVIGLTSQRCIYGNFSRYARTLFCPDSRNEPDALLPFLIQMGQSMGKRAVLFPTRDDDLVFLDAHRAELEPYFHLVMPASTALGACLDKWETYLWAERAGIPAPKSWFIDGIDDLTRILPEVTYPCVLKPLASHHWRNGRNWDIVGGRKAIGVSSADELLVEYAAIARADKRALLQVMVPGSDDCIVTAGCYLDCQSNWVTGFNVQKLLQIPERFGTGCIVQSVDCPEACALTRRLLQTMRFTGIAEVEFKRDALDGKLKLIEVNPRPWDQHRLGKSCGVDLMYVAYCEHAGLEIPVVTWRRATKKWIAEDAFLTLVIRLLWKGDPRFWSLVRLMRGKRMYAIWSFRDPVPAIAYLMTRYVPGLVATGLRFMWAKFKRRMGEKTHPQKEVLMHENLDTRKSPG